MAAVARAHLFGWEWPIRTREWMAVVAAADGRAATMAAMRSPSLPTRTRGERNGAEKRGKIIESEVYCTRIFCRIASRKSQKKLKKLQTIKIFLAVHNFPRKIFL